MKVEKRRGREERQVLIGLIADDTVLGRVSREVKENPFPFQSRWANLICKWCCSYYDKYGKAPKKDIVSLFEKWAKKSPNEEMVSLVEQFLSECSQEYEREDLNSKFLIDLAGEYFNLVKLKKLAEEIEDATGAHRTSEALQLINDFTKIKVGREKEIDLLQDKQAIREAFAQGDEVLVKYPGALGRFFQHAFERDGFLAFMGPEKVGKSFWLLDVAWRAMLQRKRVAFFECGDLSQVQVLQRFAIRAARLPRYPGNVMLPKKIRRDSSGEIIVSKEKRKFEEGVSWRKAVKAFNSVARNKVKSKRSFFKLSCHPTVSLSVDNLKTILQTWEREQDWIPDLILIDYADILGPPSGVKEKREQINTNWQLLRALSQEYHCLVVTATQSDTASYGAGLLSMKNFTDDKRKFSHVTGMIGLNSQAEEREKGIVRLNWLVLRNAKFNSLRCVTVAECKDLANPAICSIF